MVKNAMKLAKDVIGEDFDVMYEEWCGDGDQRQ